MRVKGILMGVALLAAASAMGHSRTEKTFETRVVSKPIKHGVSYQITRTLRPGRTQKHKAGKNGVLKTVYRVTLINGKPVSKVAVETRRVEPVDSVMLIGKPTYSVSRSSFTRKKTVTMNSTAYDCSPQTLPGSSGRTATGLPAKFGVVAVDPRVIKLGTFLYIEGYGFAIAADTGGAIKGNKIDLCFNSRRESLAWGRRNVIVHILR